MGTSASAYGVDAGVGLVGLGEVLEDEAYGDGEADGEEAGEDHLLQGGGGDDGDAAGVVGLGGSGHDAGVFAELVADVLDDHLGGASDGLDGEGGEEVGEHRAEEGSDEDGDLGEVDVVEGPACGHGGRGRPEAWATASFSVTRVLISSR